MPVTHAFSSGKADGGDATLVQPSNWNATHAVDTITGIQDAQTPIAFTRFFQNFVGSYNGYLQAAVQNKSSGATASSDFVATTDTGSDSAEYIDMGINGSGFAGTWGGPKDGYLYVDGGASGVGDLHIGTAQATTVVAINIGGGADANRVVQFNNAGSLWTAFSTDPATPAADTAAFYFKKIGGRVMPKWLGPSGVDTPFQPFLGMNHIRILSTGTGTTTALVCSWFGIQHVVIGTTMAQTTPASGSLKSRTRLSSIQSATTAGAIASIKGSQLEVSRETGFFYVSRWSMDTMSTTNVCFFGLYASVTAPTATVDFVTSTAVAKIGLAISANTGNWKFVSNVVAGGIIATDLGANFAVSTTNIIELVMFCAPGATQVSYRVTDLTTSSNTSTIVTASIPGATVYMTPLSTMSNNTATGAIKWSHKMIYLETDT